MSCPHSQLSRKVLHLSFCSFGGGDYVDKPETPQCCRAARSGSEVKGENDRAKEVFNQKGTLRSGRAAD